MHRKIFAILFMILFFVSLGLVAWDIEAQIWWKIPFDIGLVLFNGWNLNESLNK